MDKIVALLLIGMVGLTIYRRVTKSVSTAKQEFEQAKSTISSDDDE